MFILFLEILCIGIISYFMLYLSVIGLINLRRYLIKRKCGLHICLWCKYKHKCKPIDEDGYFSIYKSLKNKKVFFIK